MIIAPFKKPVREYIEFTNAQSSARDVSTRVIQHELAGLFEFMYQLRGLIQADLHLLRIARRKNADTFIPLERLRLDLRIRQLARYQIRDARSRIAELL